MRTPRRIIGIVLVTVTGSVWLAGANAYAEPVTLPPALTAALTSDMKRTDATLAAERRVLGRIAARQRIAVAHDAVVRDQTDAIRRMLRVIPFPIAPSVTAPLDERQNQAQRSVQRAEAALTQQTQSTARALTASLDAQRRWRAITHAARSQDSIDVSLGSWHFGSGGPAVSAASLDAYLQSKGSPMAGQGAALLKAGVRDKIDPRLVVAIAGAESYFGTTTCAPYNAWGWSCPSAPAAFTSWAHGINTITHGLRTNYVDRGRSTVGRIHLSYAPPGATNDPTDLNYGWADNVAHFLVEQGGDPQQVSGIASSGG